MGIRRLCDLVFHNRLGSYQEITNYYGHVPKKSFELLTNSIPENLIQSACNVGEIRPDSQWAYLNDGSHFLLLVTHADPTQLTADVWTLPIGSNLATAQGSTSYVNLDLLRPARFTTDGIASVTYLDCEELVPEAVVTSPPKPAKVTSKGENYWNCFLRPPPLLPVNWNPIYKRLWTQPVPQQVEGHPLVVAEELALSGLPSWQV